VISRILADRVANGSAEFLCEWRGHDTPTWQPERDLYMRGKCTCQGVLTDYTNYKASLSEKPIFARSNDASARKRSRVAPADRFGVSMEELVKAREYNQGKARSAATAASYAKLWNEAVRPYCRWQKLDEWKLTSGDIANMMAWHEITKSAGQVERLFNALRTVYASRDLLLPSSPLAREIVRGAKRIHAEEKNDLERDEFPVHEHVRLCTMDPSPYGKTPRQRRTRLRDLSIISTGLRCMRRPAELSKLKRRHVEWVRPALKDWVCPDGAPAGYENKWLKVYIRDQKQDREAAGQWILVEPTWEPACMARRLVEYCDAFNFTIGKGIDDHLPLYASRNANKGITGSAINALVKRAAKFLDLGDTIKGHSLRSGGATAAAMADVPMDIIRIIGGWRGDAAFLRYIRAIAAPAQRVSCRMGF
jgi:hypothetical protein